MNARETSVFAKYTGAETLAQIRDYDSVSEMWAHCLDAYRDCTAVTDGPDGDVKEYTFAALEADAADYRGVLAGEVNRLAAVLPVMILRDSIRQ